MGGDDLFEAKFYGLGADGTVGANKNSSSDYRKQYQTLPGILLLRL